MIITSSGALNPNFSKSSLKKPIFQVLKRRLCIRNHKLVRLVWREKKKKNKLSPSDAGTSVERKRRRRTNLVRLMQADPSDAGRYDAG
jgi:hypothetical protein